MLKNHLTSRQLCAIIFEFPPMPAGTMRTDSTQPVILEVAPSLAGKGAANG